jgi:hypothetical protein
MKKQSTITPAPSRPSVQSELDAVTLTNAVLDALETLEPVIEQETALLKEGETSAALALSPDKMEKSRDYMRAIETLKDNVIAIQRFRPDALALIRERHDAFGAVLAHNMQVLTTARSVSESIIREVSAEVAKAGEAAGYGPTAKDASQDVRKRSAPLAVFKQA